MGLTDFESNTSNDYACEFTVAKELTKIPAQKSVSYMKVLDEKQILEISGWAEFPDRQASFACMCYVLNTMQKLLKKSGDRFGERDTMLRARVASPDRTGNPLAR